jgi:hypothetical protein
MKCFRCNKGTPQHTLYRVNSKGRPGIFACSEHRLERDPELDAIIKEIVLGRVPKESRKP